jgi:hypothetical protein
MLKRISRFNYWDFIDVNPILKDQVDRRKFDYNQYSWMFDPSFSSKYEREYKSGRREAIFEFADINTFFLQYKWVRDQLQRWIHWNNQETRKWIRSLLFGSQRGRRNERNPRALQEIIERDKKVFIHLLRLRKSGHKLTGPSSTKSGKDTRRSSAFVILAKRYNMSEEGIRAVYRHYGKFQKAQEGIVSAKIDAALRRMLNDLYGKFVFTRDIRRSRRILTEIIQKQTKKVKETKSNLYRECRALMEEFRKPANQRRELGNSFALSLLTNEFGKWWQGAIAEYYPWGPTQKGFVSFLKDCQLPVRNNRLFLPYHSAILTLVETLYRGHETPSAEEIRGELDDFKVEKWLSALGTLPKRRATLDR